MSNLSIKEMKQEAKMQFLPESNGAIGFLQSGNREWQHPKQPAVRMEHDAEAHSVRLRTMFEEHGEYNLNDQAERASLIVDLAREIYHAEIMTLVQSIIQAVPVGSFWASNAKRKDWVIEQEKFASPVYLLRLAEDTRRHGSLVILLPDPVHPCSLQTIPSLCMEQTEEMQGHKNSTIREIEWEMWDVIFEFMGQSGEDPYHQPLPKLEEVQ